MPTSAKLIHLSDLHFGIHNDSDVWQVVHSHIKEISPDFLFVTGDIVHTPRQNHVRKARKALDDLGIKYLVCPGNHDRHPYGIAPGRLARLREVRPLDWVIRKLFGDQRFFAKIFEDKFPDSKNAPNSIDIDIGPENNNWKVRIIGVDSSKEALNFAYGIITCEQWQQLMSDAAKNATDVDLAILLQHHHLLPNMGLETEHQSLWSGIRFAIMLNAGTILEASAKHHFNLVLHGHDHHHTIGRFGTLAGCQGEVVVLGAASATGASPKRAILAQCDSHRVAFNLIELMPNRSVWAGQHIYDGTSWTIEKPKQLLDAYATRKTRSFRRLKGTGELRGRSEFRKYIEFRNNRDIKLAETRTFWGLDDCTYNRITRNSSGFPEPLSAEFIWESGETTKRDAEFSPMPDEEYAWRCDISDLPYCYAPKIISKWVWRGGGVLTQAELKCLSSASGEYRNEGYEYAAITAENELKLLSLVVRMPDQFAPDDVDVFYQEKSSDVHKEGLDLSEALERHGKGTFALRVPYPVIGYRYIIAWKPKHTDSVPEIVELQSELRENNAYAKKRLDPFWKHLKERDAFHKASIALYVPNGSDTSLDRAGDPIESNDLGDNKPPQSLSLMQSRLYRSAWWGGREVSALRESSDRSLSQVGFGPGERYLAIIPLRKPLVVQPLGLVRIALCAEEQPPDFLNDATRNCVCGGPMTCT